eukprot:m.356566 g.356566  ORF g.356566 m.356566 type:complete len:1555 (+) comp17582_c0_seq1:3-4667(+)
MNEPTMRRHLFSLGLLTTLAIALATPTVPDVEQLHALVVESRNAGGSLIGGEVEDTTRTECLAVLQEYERAHGQVDFSSQECKALSGLMVLPTTACPTAPSRNPILTLLEYLRTDADTNLAICKNACYSTYVDVLHLMAVNDAVCSPDIIFASQCTASNATSCAAGTACFGGTCRKTCTVATCGCNEVCTPLDDSTSICLPQTQCDTDSQCNPSGTTGKICVDGFCTTEDVAQYVPSPVFVSKSVALMCASPVTDPQQQTPQDLCLQQFPSLSMPASATNCTLAAKLSSCCIPTYNDFVGSCALELDTNAVSAVERLVDTCHAGFNTSGVCTQYPPSAVLQCHTQRLLKTFDVSVQFTPKFVGNAMPGKSEEASYVNALRAMFARTDLAFAFTYTAEQVTATATLRTLVTKEQLSASVTTPVEATVGEVVVVAQRSSVSKTASLAPTTTSPLPLPSYLQGSYVGTAVLIMPSSAFDSQCCDPQSQAGASGTSNVMVELRGTTATITVAGNQTLQDCSQPPLGVTMSNVRKGTQANTFRAKAIMTSKQSVEVDACFYFDSMLFVVQFGGACPDPYQSVTQCSAVPNGFSFIASLTCQSGMCRCSDLDPCCFPSLPHFGNFPTRVAAHSTINRCVKSLRMPYGYALNTLETLLNGLAHFYSYTELAKNSTASAYTLLEGARDCNFEVHAMEVDIVSALSSIRSQLRQELEASHTNLPADQLNAMIRRMDNTLRGVDSTPAFMFHDQVRALFARLRDAHTMYYTPYWNIDYVMPLELSSSIIADKQVIVVGGLLGERLQGSYTALFGDYLTAIKDVALNDAIESINGVPAMQWVKEQAAVIGTYKSDGVRFNAFLETTRTGVSLATDDLPPSGKVTMRLSKGTTLELNLLFLVTGDTASQGFNEFNTAMSTNARFGRMRYALLANSSIPIMPASHTMLEDMVRSKTAPASTFASEQQMQSMQSGLGLHEYQQSQQQQQLKDQERAEQEDPEHALRRRRHKRKPFKPMHIHTREKLHEYTRPESSSRGFTDASSGKPTKANDHGLQIIYEWAYGPTEVVALYQPHANRSKSAVIFKVATFSPDFGDYEDFATGLVETYYKGAVFASNHGVRRLLIDVIGNGGGYVFAASMLANLVAGPEYWYSYDQCQPYRLRMSDLLSTWLSSYGDSTQGFATAWPEELTPDDLQAFANNVTQAYVTDMVVLGGPSIDYNSLLADLQDVALKGKTNHDRASRLKRAISKGYYLGAGFVTYSSKAGWYPLQEPARFDNPNRGFSPLLEPYSSPDKRQWGGQDAYYSKQLDLECSPVGVMADEIEGLGDWLNELDAIWETAYEEVGVVTDGTCGSACALFSTILLSQGYATVFSYGGHSNEPMDISSFAGGNVEDWDSFWPYLVSAQVLGNTLKGQGASLDMDLVTASLPTPAATRFNFHMNFVRMMGTDSLPREWYNIPAHRQLNFWANINADWASNDTDALSHLYLLILDENWDNVLDNPQFFGEDCELELIDTMSARVIAAVVVGAIVLVAVVAMVVVVALRRRRSGAVSIYGDGMDDSTPVLSQN